MAGTADGSDPGHASERRERRDSIVHREQILSAARRLFAERGVDRTSMHEIGRVARVGQGTLYRNFAHKGDLCRALLEDDLEAFLARVDPTIDGVNDPWQAMDALGWLLDEMVRMIDSYIPLLTVMQEAVVGPRRYGSFQNPFYTSIHQRLAHLVRVADQEDGVVDVDAELVADAILAAVNPHVFDFQRRQRGFSTDRIAAGVRGLFVDGLRRRNAVRSS